MRSFDPNQTNPLLPDRLEAFFALPMSIVLATFCRIQLCFPDSAQVRLKHSFRSVMTFLFSRNILSAMSVVPNVVPHTVDVWAWCYSLVPIGPAIFELGRILTSICVLIFELSYRNLQMLLKRDLVLPVSVCDT